MIILYIVLGLALGGAVGYFLKNEDVKKKMLQAEADTERKIRVAEQKIHEMDQKAREAELKAREKAHEIVSTAKDEAAQKLQEVEKQSFRLEQREEELTKKTKEVDSQRERLTQKEAGLVEKEEELKETILREQTQLENIAKLSKEEAKAELFEKIEKTAEADLVNHMKRVEERIKESADAEAREAIIRAMQRLTSDVTSEATVTVVTLPNDDLKGRIIGKEGRNIQAIERATGCDIIVDDTPGAVIVSGFDLMRRYIAKRTIEDLVEDGRINPARIEEKVEQMTAKVDKMIQEAGEQAIAESGVTGLPPEVVKILGRLKFRTSYGHNVLKHSIEVALLAEALANMVGADAEVCRAAGLLHDIGKTVSQEIGGKHAVLTGEILRKFHVAEVICHTAEAHHEDFGPLDTPEKVIIQIADAISAARPGARRETSEKFIQRMKDIEATANSFPGVEKCFALQAGREVRVFVNPEKMSDLETKKLSWDIARKLEKEMQYPGEIKVIVFRETRVTEFAK